MGLDRTHLIRLGVQLRTIVRNDEFLVAVLVLAGLTMVAAGLGMIYPPASFLFVGAAALAVAGLYVRGAGE